MSDGVIAGASTEVARLIARYHISRSSICYCFNPLDLRLWYPVDRRLARERIGIPHDAEVVVNHGRTEMHRKGLDILVEAWQLVSAVREGRNPRLLLIGTGNDADALTAKIRAMQLPGILRINEFVLDQARMRDYLCSANAYVLTSRHEGFPVAPLEAMACGLPVVATCVSGIQDILKDGEHSGGVTVPVGDPRALAEALGRLLDEPQRAQIMGRAARERVETAFSIEAVGKQLRDFIFPSGSGVGLGRIA
jgi:glycosyltransferase involved in cell wall biosynthesis